jgi:hypothetical protein
METMRRARMTKFTLQKWDLFFSHSL